MSEKYPQAWRDTCLSLLEAHREDVRQSLGFKRLGWDVIRDRIMRNYDQYENGEIFLRDSRLVRQNIESWEKGKVLSDDKFKFIDKYVRELAANGSDDSAFNSLIKIQFKKNAEIISSIYTRRNSINLPYEDLFHVFPWAYYAGNITGTWYKSLAVFGLDEHNGIVRILFAYLPKEIDDLVEDDFKDVVFMEGFLIPLDYNSHNLDFVNGADIEQKESKSITELRCAVKLTRPEFQGLSGIGYADGEINIPEFGQFWELYPKFRMMVLDYPSPIPCPTISKSWIPNKFINKISGHNQVFRINIHDFGRNLDISKDINLKLQISLRYFENFDDSVLRNMLLSIYAGYIY